jgi:hypothetical protein
MTFALGYSLNKVEPSLRVELRGFLHVHYPELVFHLFHKPQNVFRICMALPQVWEVDPDPPIKSAKAILSRSLYRCQV